MCFHVCEPFIVPKIVDVNDRQHVSSDPASGLDVCSFCVGDVAFFSFHRDQSLQPE
jgi:hypothetical protein